MAERIGREPGGEQAGFAGSEADWSSEDWSGGELAAPADPESQRARNELMRLGSALVSRLFVLFKTSLNYSEGHAALEAPLAQAIGVVREIQRQGEEASLRIKGRHLYLAELRLRPQAASFNVFSFLMEEMRRHAIGAIHFTPLVTEEDLRRLVYAFREVEAESAPDSHASLLERMQQRMIANIELSTLPEEIETAGFDRERLKDGRLKARLCYQQALKAVARVEEQVSAGKPIRIREAKRVVQQMIDLLAQGESSLLGHGTRPDGERAAGHHAVKVCILSLTLGRRLGLAKFTLCELGLAALLHDLGKSELPGELLERGEGATPQEQQLLESHPMLGVKRVMQLKAVDRWSCRIITGIFEHHLLADRSGYPHFAYQRVGLFGRIIALANGFELLTSPRCADRSPYPPDKALRFMLTQVGKAYDQALLKLFIGCVGVQPIGCLLQLDSGELAVVVENHPDPGQWGSPQVKIIADAAGREVDGEVVDLARPDSGRHIAASLDPRLFQLDVSRYLQ